MRTRNITGIALIANSLASMNLGAYLQERQCTHMAIHTDEIVLVGVFNSHPIPPAIVFTIGNNLSVTDGHNRRTITGCNVYAIVRRSAISPTSFTTTSIAGTAIPLGCSVFTFRR